MSKENHYRVNTLKYALSLIGGDVVVFVLPYVARHHSLHGYLQSNSAIWFWLGLIDVPLFLIGASYEPLKSKLSTEQPKYKRRDVVIAAIALLVFFFIGYIFA